MSDPGLSYDDLTSALAAPDVSVSQDTGVDPNSLYFPPVDLSSGGSFDASGAWVPPSPAASSFPVAAVVVGLVALVVLASVLRRPR